MTNTRQELYCHACQRYVQFTIDDELDGNHDIECPNCGHMHYRYVDKGQITDIRHKSSGPTYVAINVTYSASTTASGPYNFLADSWASTTTSSYQSWSTGT